MLRIIKITGQSMQPELKEGDFVVVAAGPLFFYCLKPGQQVLFTHPEYGLMVKGIERVSKDEELVWVRGHHPHSVDSRRFGPVSYGKLVGRVIWTIKS